MAARFLQPQSQGEGLGCAKGHHKVVSSMLGEYSRQAHQLQ